MKNTIKIYLVFILSFGFSVSFAQVIETIEDDTVEESCIQYVEIDPDFIGGDKARLKFLADNIKYPQEAQNKKIEGTVYVTFVVEKDGRVANIKVLRGIGAGCDSAAVNAVKKMPNWKPATQRGKPIRCQFNMPIKFMLSDNSLEEKELTRKEKRALKKKTPKQ